MASETTIITKVDADLEEQAAAIFKAAGLTISDVFRIMLLRTIADRSLPFDPFFPNEDTLEAMKAARRGELIQVGTVENLLADLHAED